MINNLADAVVRNERHKANKISTALFFELQKFLVADLPEKYRADFLDAKSKVYQWSTDLRGVNLREEWPAVQDVLLGFIAGTVAQGGPAPHSVPVDLNIARLLLLKARTGVPPYALELYPPKAVSAMAVYLVNGGFVNGNANQDPNGACISVKVEGITAKGLRLACELANRDAFMPPQIFESLGKFREDHQDQDRVAFVMTQADGMKSEVFDAIASVLSGYDVKPLLAHDRKYHAESFPNALTYMYGCGIGIAVLEGKVPKKAASKKPLKPAVELNGAGVLFEAAHMMAIGKPVCIFKDQDITLPKKDVVRDLVLDFDVHDLPGTFQKSLRNWLAKRLKSSTSS